MQPIKINKKLQNVYEKKTSAQGVTNNIVKVNSYASPKLYLRMLLRIKPISLSASFIVG